MIKNKMLNVILILVVLSLVLVGCSGNTQNGGSKDSGQREEGFFENTYEDEWEREEREQKEKERQLTQNIDVKGEFGPQDEFIVYLKNNNSEAVDINLEVEFYDKEGAFLGSEESSLDAINGNKESVVLFEYIDPKVSRFELYADAEEAYYNGCLDQVEVTYNNTGKEVLVQAKNNAEEEISKISLVCFFYNQGKLVDIVDDSEYDIKSGRSANFEFEPMDSETYRSMNFDDCKIVVSQAYRYDV